MAGEPTAGSSSTVRSPGRDRQPGEMGIRERQRELGAGGVGRQRELLGGDRDHGRGVTQGRGAAVLREVGAHGSSFRALVGTCTLELDPVPDSAQPLITCATLSSCQQPGHACVAGFLGELGDLCAAVATERCHEGQRTHVQSRTFPCLSEPLHGDAPGDKRRRRGSPAFQRVVSIYSRPSPFPSLTFSTLHQAFSPPIPPNVEPMTSTLLKIWASSQGPILFPSTSLFAQRF